VTKTKQTKRGATKEAPIIDLPSQPEEPEMVLQLLNRYRVCREDDTPEEGANRLSAMALMLSNLASAHLVASAEGIEADLGVGFAVEGGFLPYDMEQSVLAPASRLQDQLERNLLHDVDSDTPGHDSNGKPLKKTSPDFYDALLLPAPRMRRTVMEMQKQFMTASHERAERRKTSEALASASHRPSNPNEDVTSFVPGGHMDELLYCNREQTVFREALGYRVILADATSTAGLDKRAMKAHLGRFVIHSHVASYDALERMGKTLDEFARHRNVRQGDATLTLRADPVLCVGPGVLDEAVMRGSHLTRGFNRLLWLVESAAGYDLPDGAEPIEQSGSRVLNFTSACQNEISRRINFTNTQVHELGALTGHMAGWRMFLREQERHHPGMAGAAGNLPFALCYGLEALKNHKGKVDGKEVIALAKWLVMRMSNRLASASNHGQHSRIERLAAKLANKLVTDGPMTVRDLTRKCSKLTAPDCRQALDWLEERQIATQKNNEWGIRGDAPAVKAFMAANAD
jgi:hypothetical protein